jgi:hypothetical protein
MVRMIVAAACSLAVLIGSAAAEEKRVTDDQYAELRKNFLVIPGRAFLARTRNPYSRSWL